MVPRVLFMVDSDPRTSGRPAEAVRIAAGVGVWRNVDVVLCLRGAAAAALDEFLDELVDHEVFERYLPVISEWGRPIYVSAPQAFDAGTSPRCRVEAIEGAWLAELVRTSTYVLRF